MAQNLCNFLPNLYIYHRNNIMYSKQASGQKQGDRETKRSITRMLPYPGLLLKAYQPPSILFNAAMIAALNRILILVLSAITIYKVGYRFSQSKPSTSDFRSIIGYTFAWLVKKDRPCSPSIPCIFLFTAIIMQNQHQSPSVSGCWHAYGTTYQLSITVVHFCV